MTRTIGHGTAGTYTNTQGKEWWTRRPFSCDVAPGSTWTHKFKQWTHRLERRAARTGLRSPPDLDG